MDRLARSLVVMLCVLTAGCDVAAGARPTVSARYPAVLAAQIGTWRAQGWVWDVNGGRALDAAWRCRRAADGTNDCKWRARERDRFLESDALEPALAKFMETLAPADPGSLRGHWSFVDGAERGVGVNEIRIVSPREWEQRTVVDIGGRRVLELTLTHRRIR